MIGPVNLRAEEDEKEIAQEFDTLNAQKKDLEGAVKKLRKAIADLNKEGRGKLLSAFEQVNENFQKLIKTLFGGGSSNLMFIESEGTRARARSVLTENARMRVYTQLQRKFIHQFC